jgi:RNA polymerase sigma-70 factor (ECF subfamily)
VFELKHIEHLEKAEIANRLGISTKQVEKQLRQALVRCRSILNRKNSL